jgi:adenosylmethionine-8-amino-7-oxononanoate aminotransferase
MEVALKLAYEFARVPGGAGSRDSYRSQTAYHGDTMGAVSLGHIELFHEAYAGLLFKSDKVMSPYCYRCPFNRAKPERADAREYRQCNWECVGKVEQKFAARSKRGNPTPRMVIEPLIQGAAGMIPHPAGWLRCIAEIVRGHRAQLIADEVMTGFGRASAPSSVSLQPSNTVFACHHEGVQPDFLAHGQRIDRRLSANGRHTDDASGVRCVPG